MNADRVCMFPVHFENGVLFFSEGRSGLETDSWRKSAKYDSAQILRTKQNDILIAKPDAHADCKAIFEPMTDQEMRNVPGIKFDIHRYEDTMPRGLPVAFTTIWANKTYCMCVVKGNNNMRVEFQERDAPRRIDGPTSDVIFIKTPFSEGDGQYFMFETALEKGYFLAFEKKENGHAKRLIVKKKEAMDEVDESIKINHSPFPLQRQ
ncbi:interleukin-18-like [Elgaria multicarinata webbii]|uniref:interleukin-18-like n=1 Tax=Elgaria multicarinata webbii TaxID=159646 RepID=UPI002FCCBEB1